MKILFFFFAFLFVSAASAQLLGGWAPIQDVTDPAIQGIAKFAVAEHNRKSGDNLVYVRVVGGQQQVVGGMKYRLRILARQGYYSRLGLYEATVYERAWENYRELMSFVRVN